MIPPTLRKVMFLTATRADFGKLKPLISKIAAEPAFHYEIFVTGMHMLSRYGSTFHEIEKSGFKNIFRYTNQDGSVTSQMDLVLANTLQGLGLHVRESRPDLIVVHGDRIECLAGAIAGVLNNTLVAHVEGGEVSGTVDEVLRHAVTKLSHVHFVANELAANRLMQLGENPSSVFVIGSPEIDVMLSDGLPDIQTVKDHYEIPFDDYCVFIYHPVTTEHAQLRQKIREITAALTESNMNFVVIQPNNDFGANIIQEELGSLEHNPRFRMIPSMKFEFFLSLMKHSRVVIGNSSAGIREAPVYGVPTINIGSRQLNRWKGKTIVNVPETTAALLRALKSPPARGNAAKYFGDGHSAERFLEILKTDELWATSVQKFFRDVPITAV